VLLTRLLDLRILFVGGKGGVGKTTIASSLALLAASSGRRVLVVSTDPAHSLADIFDKSIGDQEVSLSKNLWALEIDSDREADRHISTVKQNMKTLVAPKMYAEIDRQLDLARYSPGAVEAAVLERVTDLMAAAGTRYDLVIFDTAPTGHTVRLLSLPEIITAWTEGMLNHQDRSKRLGSLLDGLQKNGEESSDSGMMDFLKNDSKNQRNEEISRILQNRRDKFFEARKSLTDPRATGFLLVLNPERLPILESKKAFDVLSRFQIEICGMVINRILPSDLTGDFLRSRLKQQSHYMEEISREFSGVRSISVPLLERDVYGMGMLENVGQILSTAISSSEIL
jgi:arsenite-transporting ATPase